MAERIRVAVLGAGRFAGEAHIPGLKAHPAAEVVALYSRSLDQARRVAEPAGGVPLVTDDLHALLARDDVDAVTVASSDDNHYRYTMAALRAGKHVYCEKPLAVNATLASEMAREATARGVVNFVGFIFRYTYCVQELCRLVRAGDIGTPYFVVLEWLGYADLNRQRRQTWRDRAETYGAGFVAEIGSHFVDTVNWIVAPVQEVCAVVHAIPRTVTDAEGREVPHETPDHASALVRTTSGAQGQLTVSRLTPARDPLPFVQVVGEKGALWASLTRGQQEVLRRMRPGGRWEDVELPGEAKDGKPHAISRMMGAFVDACLAGRVDPARDADFAAGYRVQSALDQLVASAESRRFEPVALGL